MTDREKFLLIMADALSQGWNFRQMIPFAGKIVGLSKKDSWLQARAALTGKTEGIELGVIVDIIGNEKAAIRFLSALCKWE